jgi:hypothetical protein
MIRKIFNDHLAHSERSRRGVIRGNIDPAKPVEEPVGFCEPGAPRAMRVAINSNPFHTQLLQVITVDPRLEWIKEPFVAAQSKACRQLPKEVL